MMSLDKFIAGPNDEMGWVFRHAGDMSSALVDEVIARTVALPDGGGRATGRLGGATSASSSRIPTPVSSRRTSRRRPASPRHDYETPLLSIREASASWTSTPGRGSTTLSRPVRRSELGKAGVTPGRAARSGCSSLRARSKPTSPSTIHGPSTGSRDSSELEPGGRA